MSNIVRDDSFEEYVFASLTSSVRLSLRTACFISLLARGSAVCTKGEFWTKLRNGYRIKRIKDVFSSVVWYDISSYINIYMYIERERKIKKSPRTLFPPTIPRGKHPDPNHPVWGQPAPCSLLLAHVFSAHELTLKKSLKKQVRRQELVTSTKFLLQFSVRTSQNILMFTDC